MVQKLSKINDEFTFSKRNDFQRHRNCDANSLEDNNNVEFKQEQNDQDDNDYGLKYQEKKLKKRICDYLSNFEFKRFCYDAHIKFRRIRLQIISRLYERHKDIAKKEAQIIKQIGDTQAQTLALCTKAEAQSIRLIGGAGVMLNYVEELKKVRGMVTFARCLSDFRIAQIYEEVSGIILDKIATVFGLDPQFRFKLERPLNGSSDEYQRTLHHFIVIRSFEDMMVLKKKLDTGEIELNEKAWNASHNHGQIIDQLSE